MEFFRWRSFAGVVEWCEFIDGEIGENLFPEKFCPWSLLQKSRPFLRHDYRFVLPMGICSTEDSHQNLA
jgi:hypothetical protein